MIDRRQDGIRRIQNLPVEDDRRENPHGRRENDGLKAVFSVAEHLITGNVTNNGQRLLDVLNDQMSDFVTLHDVEVFAANGAFISEIPNAVIPKPQLQLAAVLGARHEAPEKRHTRFRTKKQFRAFLLADRFAVDGTLHLEGSGHAAVTLQNELGDYVAVDHAVVTNLYGDATPVEVQVALVRKSSVTLLQIGDRVAAPTSIF